MAADILVGCIGYGPGNDKVVLCRCEFEIFDRFGCTALVHVDGFCRIKVTGTEKTFHFLVVSETVEVVDGC